jgi:hypothetical protein
MPPSILLLLSEKDPVMLTNRQIEYYAKDAGRVAYAVLGLDCDYSISLIDDPTICQVLKFGTMYSWVQVSAN